MYHKSFRYSSGYSSEIAKNIFQFYIRRRAEWMAFNAARDCDMWITLVTKFGFRLYTGHTVEYIHRLVGIRIPIVNRDGRQADLDL